MGMGPGEMVIVAIIAVMLFGKRLPEVARSLGKQYGQFRKGLTDMQSEFRGAMYEVENQSSTSSNRYSHRDDFDYQEPTAPRFELPAQPPSPMSDPATPNGDRTS
ncbi:MAG: twin-arginine translocase TatA/TatE family subunit [Planctomycetales bacterium]|nr:twin-arginine translocase TatA/TatE family subunit [Planctomycetales bacterium]